MSVTAEPRNAQEVARRLGRLIDQLGFSQRQLADACGVSQQSVSRWRSGVSAPAPERIDGLVKVLDELEAVAWARLEMPDGDVLRASRFLRSRGVDHSFAILLPPHPHQSVKAHWNAEYERARDDLISRVPLLRMTFALGHGISTMAREVEQSLQARRDAGWICVRLSVERLLAVHTGMTEREIYIGIANALYGSPEFGPDHVDVDALTEFLADGRAVSDSVESLIAHTVHDEIIKPELRRSLGSDRYERIVDQLGGPDSRAGWREALQSAGPDLQLIVLLDVSPSPLARRYEEGADSVVPGHRRVADAIVSAAAAVTARLPRVSYFVLEGGREANVSPLESASGQSRWEEFAVPRLDRNDLLEILATHLGRDRNELASVIDPRFLPDMERKGLASASWELRKKMELALANEVDHAGVIRPEDAANLNAFVLQRLADLEARVKELARSQHSLERRLRDADLSSV